MATRGTSSRLSKNPTVAKPARLAATTGAMGWALARPTLRRTSAPPTSKLQRVTPKMPCSNRTCMNIFLICQGKWFLSLEKNQCPISSEKSPLARRLRRSGPNSWSWSRSAVPPGVCVAMEKASSLGAYHGPRDKPSPASSASTVCHLPGAAFTAISLCRQLCL